MKVISGDIKTAARKEITKSIKKVVLASLNFYGGVGSFRIDMTIQQVIDDHFNERARLKAAYNHPITDDSNERFKLYVCAVDNIIEGIKSYYPFIDLTGIDMNWKIKQIIEIVAKAYFSMKPKTLEDLKKEGIIK